MADDEAAAFVQAVQAEGEPGIEHRLVDMADLGHGRNHAPQERLLECRLLGVERPGALLPLQPVAEAMAQATEGLGQGLKHLASGDLTFQLTDPFAADFETLRADFNAAVMQLSKTLRAVADATGAIDSSSKEVNACADDLSKRTEQQASSLEETAAALDQITVNVANSSKRSEEARKIAVLANDSAARSGRVVANAVDAMQKIEQSSNEISSIIGVIDEIAFQTNLLALNAGVEAACAGEAGKGLQSSRRKSAN